MLMIEATMVGAVVVLDTKQESIQMQEACIQTSAFKPNKQLTAETMTTKYIST